MTQHWPDELWANENPAMVPFTPDGFSGPQNGAEGLRDWASALIAEYAPVATYRRWLPGDPEPPCDCPMNPFHRWNCSRTPIWAQTIRDLDLNPWTVIRPRDLALDPDNIHDHCYGGDE